MLVHRKVTPSIKFAGYWPLIYLGGERYCESVSSESTKHSLLKHASLSFSFEKKSMYGSFFFLLPCPNVHVSVESG